MNPEVRGAVDASHLRDLPSDLLDELFVDSMRVRLPAGEVVHRESARGPYLDLLLAGVVRVFITAPDGRTMTIRYCRKGELLGAMSLFLSDFTEPATKQALVETELLKLSTDAVRRAVDRDARIARVFLTELSERARGFVGEIPGNAFATVRQRVARQLLDLVSTRLFEAGPAGELAVQITQQDLAAAAGTVREVVVRALRQLRESGAVRTERDRIVILDPALLTMELGWNTSS